MAKSHKDTPSPEEIKQKKRKRFMRKLKSNILVILLIALGVGIYQPQLNPIKEIDPYLNRLHQLVFQSQTGDRVLPKLDTAWVTKTRDQVLGLTHTVKVPKNLSGLPEDVVVDEAINMLASEVKALPQKQIDRIKVNICEQIIAESTDSANNSND